MVQPTPVSETRLAVCCHARQGSLRPKRRRGSQSANKARPAGAEVQEGQHGWMGLLSVIAHSALTRRTCAESVLRTVKCVSYPVTAAPSLSFGLILLFSRCPKDACAPLGRCLAPHLAGGATHAPQTKCPLCSRRAADTPTVR